MRIRLERTLHLLTAVLVFGLLMVLPIKGQVVHASGTYDGLTVTGGTKGTDYDYDSSSGRLTIKTSTALTLSGTPTGSQHIYINKDVNANLTLNNLEIDRYSYGTEKGAGIIIADDSRGDVTITLLNNNIILGRNAPAIQKNGAKSSGVGTLIFKGSGKVTVQATANLGAGEGPAVIGGATGKATANIQFDGGTFDISSYAGAAIGGGYGADGTDITINGGTIKAYLRNGSGKSNPSGLYGAVIGGGYNGNGKNITINGGTVDVNAVLTDSKGNAVAGTTGAAIGGGACDDIYPSTGGKGENIVINGGTITATAGDSAAIGGGVYCYGSNSVEINGGFITTAKSNRAAIGSGNLTPSKVTNNNLEKSIMNKITITGGTVTATGGTSSPGIGVGRAGSVAVYISGGSINAKGGTTQKNKNGSDIGIPYDQLSEGYDSKLVFSENDSEEVVLQKIQLSSKNTVVTPYLIYKNSQEPYDEYGIKDLKTDTQGYLYLYFRKSLEDKIEVGTLGPNECLEDFTISLNKDGSAWADAGEVTLVRDSIKYSSSKIDNQYRFKGKFTKGTYYIYVNGVSTGKQIKLSDTATTNQTINYYTVSWENPAHGTIAGPSTALEGVNYSFTVTPDNGYSVTEVAYTVGGKKTTLNGNGTYTIPGTAITDSITLSATISDGRGTPIDVSKVTWNYDSTNPYYFKNAAYEVKLINLPDGVADVKYGGTTTASVVDTYTATAQLVPKTGYYVPENAVIPDCNWEIKEYTIANVDSILKYNNAAKKDWYNGNVTVTAEGYQIAEGAYTGTFQDKVVFADTGSKNLYFKNKTTGYITTTAKRVEVKIDITAPTGSILLDGATFKSLNQVAGEQPYHLHDANPSASFTRTDDGSGIKSMQYALAAECHTAEEKLKGLDWKDAVVGSSYSWESGKAVYLKLEDNAGNVTYLSTPVIVNDTVPPKKESMEFSGETATSVNYTFTFNEICNYAYILEDSTASADTITAQYIKDNATAKMKGKAIRESSTFDNGLKPNTTYTVYLVLWDDRTDLSKNSNPNTSEVYQASFTTKAATLEGVDKELWIKAGSEATTIEIDLSTMLKSNVDISKLGNISYDAQQQSGEIISNLNRTGSILNISVNSNLAEGLEQKINVTIRVSGYNAIPAVITLKTNSRTPVTLKEGEDGVTVANAVYKENTPHGYSGVIKWMNGYNEIAEKNKTIIQYTGIKKNGEKYESTEAPTDAGDYEVTFEYEDSDYIGKATYYYTIEMAEVPEMDQVEWYVEDDSSQRTYKPTETATVEYDNKPHTVQVKNYPVMVSPKYSNEWENKTAVGQYVAYVDFNVLDAYKYNYKTPSPLTLSWEIKEQQVISKIKPDMSKVQWVSSQAGTAKSPIASGDTLTANGSPYTVEIIGLKSYVQCEYSGDSPTQTNIGSYSTTVTFTVDEQYYEKPEPSSMVLKWKIAEEGQDIPDDELEQPDMSQVGWVYKQDGTAKTPMANGTKLKANGKAYTVELTELPEGVTVTYSGKCSATDAGKYTAIAVFSVDETEYKKPDNMTLNWEIEGNAGGGILDPEPPTVTIPSVGHTETVNNQKYKVTSASATGGTVEYTGPVNKNVTTVSIPNSITIGGKEYKVTSVGKDAFKGCSKLKKVTVPNNVTTIGNGAFQNCKKLTKVTLGSGLIKIGDKAFYNCTALTKITIPKNVTTIGKQAFSGCKKLKTITIKSTVLKKVGAKAIKGINKKATIKCPNKKIVAKYKKLFKSKTGYVKTMKIK